MNIIEELLKGLRIRNLRKQARYHYIAYCSIADEYSCGLALAEQISPNMVHHKQEVNRILDELTELDPDTPKDRL
jgi:hypothetical protein